MAHILPDGPAVHCCAACGRPLPRFTSASASTEAPAGWTCPGCGHSYAPWVPECHHCPAPEPSFAAFSGYDPGPIAVGSPLAPSSAISSLMLPAEWNMVGYQRFVRACGEWREVTPGLQVLLGQPVSDGEEAILHFRLAPDGSQ